MIGVTLIRVSRSNGALEKDVRVEIVAACLYGRAAEHGVEPTRVWITAELERLRNHSPTCLCSEPCQLSRGVTASGVHRVGEVLGHLNGGHRPARATVATTGV